ncbi:MAG TPA: hypothetical protein VHY35_22760 [Stellaceae bacterium]|nr:hypothetical protein [Stellaceae bacterium]
MRWRTRNATQNPEDYPIQPDWAGGSAIGHSFLSDEVRAEDKQDYGQLFTTKEFGNPDDGIVFERCTFFNCIFTADAPLSFSYCRLIDCQFWPGSDDKTKPRHLYFYRCELRERWSLNDANTFGELILHDTSFGLCNFVAVRFFDVELTGNSIFLAPTGLPLCQGLGRIRVQEQTIADFNYYLCDTRLDYFDQYASWEKLRSFGRLPLFGTSLSALVSIPLLFFALSYYNDHVRRLHDAPTAADFKLFVNTLHEIPLPALSFWLLISTLLLGIASSIYSLACPARVREFSQSQWTDQFGKSGLVYLSDSWSRRRVRALVAAFYWIGGAGTSIILLIKLWNAAVFIWKNSTFGWLA